VVYGWMLFLARYVSYYARKTQEKNSHAIAGFDCEGRAFKNKAKLRPIPVWLPG
jgi:hypothetical protein